MKCKKKWQKTAIFQGFLSVFINEMWLRDRTSGWGLNSNMGKCGNVIVRLMGLVL